MIPGCGMETTGRNKTELCPCHAILYPISETASTSLYCFLNDMLTSLMFIHIHPSSR